MYQGLYIAATGGMMQERRLDKIVNNVANVNSNGYKRDFPVFESFLPPGSEKKVNSESAFVVTVAQGVDYIQGPMIQTEDPLDVSIEGEGFFAVQVGEETFYTRKGDFTLDRNRKVVTQNGSAVLGNGGEIVIPSGKSITIDEKGKIFIQEENKNTVVDTLKIVNFPKPYSLEKVGDGLFKAVGEANEQEVTFQTTRIRQGFVEGSNVNAVNEMVAMIDASRAYESYNKVMKSIDEMNGKAVSEISRVG